MTEIQPEVKTELNPVQKQMIENWYYNYDNETRGKDMFDRYRITRNYWIHIPTPILINIIENEGRKTTDDNYDIYEKIKDYIDEIKKNDSVN